VPTNNVLVVEDDPFLRVVGLLLDPNTSAERYAAFADFFAHDEPDFAGYVARVRERVGALFPSDVRIVSTQDELRAALPGSRALIVEGLTVGADELAVRQVGADAGHGVGAEPGHAQRHGQGGAARRGRSTGLRGGRLLRGGCAGRRREEDVPGPLELRRQAAVEDDRPGRQRRGERAVRQPGGRVGG